MKDRVPGKPGRYKATVTETELQKMQNGTPFNITLTRNDDPQEPGTPYSKAAVLPDDVAALMNLDVNDPTPADMFRALAMNKVATGYGIGQNNIMHEYPPDGSDLAVDVRHADDCVLPGWYTVDDVQAEGLFAVGVLFPLRVDSNKVQTAHFLNGSTLYILRRSKDLFGAWQPWEWENPPMEFGMEYRTTERNDGKPVYVKKIDLGQLPNAGSKSVDHGISGGNIFFYDAYAKSSTSTVVQNMPLISSATGTVNAKVYPSAASVYINTFVDMTDYTAYITLKYTKG